MENMNNNPRPPKPVAKRATVLGSLSLRAKLILGNMLIIALAIVGTGYYVYSRTNEANTYLTGQLDNNVLEQAQNSLNNISTARATELNNFFVLMSRDIASIATTGSNLLSQETVLNNVNYWNALFALGRLPNRSWDNSNNEISSVFIPAKAELTPDLVVELDTIKQLDLTVPNVLKQNPDTVAIYFGGGSGETIYYPNIDLSALVPPDFDVTGRPWYVAASPAQNPDKKSVWSDPYLDAASHGLIVTTSAPVYDARGSFHGVAAMDIQLNRITELVSKIQVGKTGYAILIDKNKRLIALPPAGYKDLGISADTVPLGEILDPAKLSVIPSTLFDVFDKTAAGKSGFDTLSFAGVERFVSYDPIPVVGYGLVVIAPSNELLANAIAVRQQIKQETTSTLTRSLLLVVAILVVALVATLLIGNSLTSPLIKLTKTAEEITDGNLAAEAGVQGRDEVGTLAKAINTMTSSMRNMIQSLEQQVQDRTNDLLRKTLSLQSAALVAHDAAETQDLKTLLTRTVEMITNRFGFYHVGIFLLDDSGEHAVLQAASSEGGQRMLARGHKLAVGLQGIVGTSAYQNRSQVVMDVESAPNYYHNPDLPLTRSEAAIPLKARGNVLGILDIQSTESSAFHQDDIDVLQTMADQIGLAIQNARLIGESQDAIQRLEVTTAENIRRVWRERVQTDQRSYRYTSMGLTSATQPGNMPNHGETSSDRLNVPITLRGQTLGTIVLHRKAERAWSETDRILAAEIASQVGLALENARLLDEAQRRAAQEQSLSKLTASMGLSLDPDTILQTAIRELHQLPNVAEVSAFISSPQSSKDEGPNLK
jgi:GAF domain-containing protein/HAMP domain-containing protein